MTAVDHFEAQYRADPDPWGYRCSAYERAKYDATLSACGPGPFENALELGGSIGVFSARLAPRITFGHAEGGCLRDSSGCVCLRILSYTQRTRAPREPVESTHLKPRLRRW